MPVARASISRSNRLQACSKAPWQCLYSLPEPQGQTSLVANPAPGGGVAGVAVFGCDGDVRCSRTEPNSFAGIRIDVMCLHDRWLRLLPLHQLECINLGGDGSGGGC